MDELRKQIADIVSDKLGGDHYSTAPEDIADAVIASVELELRAAYDRGYYEGASAEALKLCTPRSHD